MFRLPRPSISRFQERCSRRSRGKIAAKIFLALLIATWAAERFAYAEQGELTTHDGQKYRGDITEDGDRVTVNNKGIVTKFARGDVVAIEYFKNLRARLDERRARLRPSDVDGRLELAREAFDAREYLLARHLCEEALQLDPNNAMAVELGSLARKQMLLEANGDKEPATTAPTYGAPNPIAPYDRVMLKPEDINMIRLMELRDGDTAARLSFSNDVEKRFADAASIDQLEFRRMKALDKALQIRDRGTVEMMRDVHVMNDPASISEFKRGIHRVILTGCATANCHGGPRAGDFILHTPPDTDAVTYTNFYILTRYKKTVRGEDSAIFGSADGAARPMIDRGRSSQSLLVQYALPREIAELRHPKAQKYDGIFRDKDDDRLTRLANWMDRILAPLPGDYHIDYTLPGATASPSTSRSSTEPAAQSATTKRATTATRPTPTPPSTRPATRPTTRP